MDENVFKIYPLRLVGSPCPWLVSGLLSSLVYGIYCNMYTRDGHTQEQFYFCVGSFCLWYQKMRNLKIRWYCFLTFLEKNCSCFAKLHFFVKIRQKWPFMPKFRVLTEKRLILKFKFNRGPLLRFFWLEASINGNLQILIQLFFQFCLQIYFS